MNDLRRELAPVTDEAWEEVSAEAKRTLTNHMAARRLVDFSGPHGWTHSAVNLGRGKPLESAPADDVRARLRTVQPLVELQIPFELSRDELDSIARGADDADLGPVIDAARQLACAEDRLVFYGFEAGGVDGLCVFGEAITHAGGIEAFPDAVTQAAERLREAGVAGPYGIALQPSWYNDLAKSVVPVGSSLLSHVQGLLGGPVVWAPAISDAVVVATRGGDFELTVGRDASIGYLDHDPATVRLYLEESLTFRILTPEAAVTIRPGS